jgi:hypothetical protein
MIVKKVAKMRKGGGGSFGGLADYIIDVENEGEKVRDYEFTNCTYENDFFMNVKEIEAIQSLNTMAKSDKTFHMIVSFVEDENPSLETMRAIEEEFVKSIGFENHQRLSVIHDNTNNLHMHIAINRIDPDRLTIKDPFRDMFTLQNKAIELEEKYNLKPTNHLPKDREPVKIKDKEIHSGVQSFLSWIKEDVAGEIKEVLKDETKSLEDLHTTLNKYNLELRERGAGIVISDKDRALYVKASDVDRGLSKGSLTKRYGEFKPSRIDEPAVTKFGVKKSSLWDEYQKETKEKRNIKKELLETLSSKSTKTFKDLKDDYGHRREVIKDSPTLNTQVKREAYRILGEERARELKSLKDQFTGERSKIHKHSEYKTYTDYLTGRAANRDLEALNILRSKSTNDPSVNTLTLKDGEHESQYLRTLPGQKIHVSKNGNIFYKIDGGKIIDAGRSLKLVYDKSEKALREFMDLAKIKFGTMSALVIQGSKEFKERVYELNKTIGLKLDNKGIEKDKDRANERSKSENRGMEL